MNYSNFYKQFKNKKVLVTGHTGFKGSWLTSWLVLLGANVTGLSIDIPSNPSHFQVIKLHKKINHKKADIRNLQKLKKIIKTQQPDYVFHLAAQALVKKSYQNSIYTWETNTMGTINVLESLKEIKKNCTVVLITSDKSYKNLEIKRGYKENDLLGGKDPYSASKAATELAIQSYISSFFPRNKSKVSICIARAGNVIGGGDWSENRLIPDCVKSWSKKRTVLIRNPKSTRPWQHVIEAVYGYLLLALMLKKNKKLHGEAFNFGPTRSKNYNVLSTVTLMKKYWKQVSWKVNKQEFYESNLLKLNSEKARIYLGWKCILNFDKTIKMVTEWYKIYYSKPKTVYQTTFNQIKQYEKILKEKK